MQKINLNNFGRVLHRDEMKIINGGRVSVICNPTESGQTTMSSNSATWNQAVSYAESNCTNGYTIVCSAEHCA